MTRHHLHQDCAHRHPPPGRVRNPDHHRLTKELRDLRTSRFPRTHSSHNTASKLIAPATMASTRIALHDNIWAFEQLSCNSIPELRAKQNLCTACEQAKPAMDRGPAIQCRDPLVSQMLSQRPALACFEALAAEAQLIASRLHQPPTAVYNEARTAPLEKHTHTHIHTHTHRDTDREMLARYAGHTRSVPIIYGAANSTLRAQTEAHTSAPPL